MNKTEFLKEAQAKFKETNEKVTNGVDWVSEMNFIFSKELVLRVWFDKDFNPNNKHGDTGLRHRWCPVLSLPCQADDDIIRRLQEITCPVDGEQNNEEIIEFLRNADEDTLDEQAIGFEFTDKNGKVIEIMMWENCDHFTLRMVYEHIGL